MPTIHQAKTNLSRLIEKAERGEEVVISRGKEPVVRLVLVSKHSGKRQLGILKGKYKIDPVFFEPLPQDELDAWYQ
jgi:prevent-host-death family protein